MAANRYRNLFQILPLLFLFHAGFQGCGQRASDQENISPDLALNYPVHRNIVTTFFWVGEDAGADNGGISNAPSAWDDHWVIHYGGVDDPLKRNGWFPENFIPKENPFYFALPYNDFDDAGERKPDASTLVYWADEKSWGDLESMVKNRWMKITKGNKTCYAQWEDAGPFLYNDSNYVFGTANPSNTEGAKAGLDVSPAVKNYLGLDDTDTVDWQFVRQADVPEGPWKLIITASQIDWD